LKEKLKTAIEPVGNLEATATKNRPTKLEADKEFQRDWEINLEDCTRRAQAEDDAAAKEELAQSDPLEAKKHLAAEIVRRYHGDQVAKEEREWFDKTFSRRQTPTDIPEITVCSLDSNALEVVQKFFGDQKSRSELRRLFQQGGISRNNARIIDPMERILLSEGDVFQVGKRIWFRVNFQK